VLRRLERNHDGFSQRKDGRNAIKIYQTVAYLGWSIHNPPNLGLLAVRRVGHSQRNKRR
jgi:hypothetical protein